MTRFCMAQCFWLLLTLACCTSFNNAIFSTHVERQGAVKKDTVDKVEYIGDSGSNMIKPRDTAAKLRRSTSTTTTTTTTTTTPSSTLSMRTCDSTTMFRCLSGECVSKNFKCDGQPDCNDHSDEHGCIKEHGQCSEDKFECKKERACIPKRWRCDGGPDCGDGTDEMGCEELKKCDDSQYRCPGGDCISRQFLCDKVLDCPNGEDEMNCESTQCLEQPGHFQCSSDECVPPEKVCDGKNDCKDGSEEGPRCNETCEEGHCSQKCFLSSRGPHCFCNPGYKLQSDHTTCQDIDECSEDVLACDHKCSNLKGSFYCTCQHGYQLENDNVTCKSTVSGPGFLLVAQASGIRQLALDSSSYTQIYWQQGPHDQVVGIGYDPTDKLVYWSTVQGILTAPLKRNAEPRLLINQELGLVEDIGVDWQGRNLYMTCPEHKAIIVCSMDGINCHQPITGAKRPRPIQLDISARRMYWGDVETAEIETAGMDGSERRVLVSRDLGWPNAIALDIPAGRLYYMDAMTDIAHSIKLDGTDRKNLPKATVSHPFSMAVWEEHLYWTSWDSDLLLTCNKRDGRKVHKMLKGIHKLQYFGISLFHPAMLLMPTENPCDSADCSHLCLLKPSFPHYACACPIGDMHLSDDGHTCLENSRKSSLLLFNSSSVYMQESRMLGRTLLNRWPLPSSIRNIGYVTYDPRNDVVLFSDVWWKYIYAVNLTYSTGLTELVTNTAAYYMEMDWVRGNLYWVDGKKDVEVGAVRDGKLQHRKQIVSDLRDPTGLALAPLLGYLFVCGQGELPYIKRCGLDGTDCINIITYDLHQPRGLVFDRDPVIKRLYWCNSGEGKIESATYEGYDRKIIADTKKTNPPGSPISLVVSGNMLKWTLKDEPYLFETSKFDPDAVIKKRVFSSGKKLSVAEVGWLVQSATIHPCTINNGNCSHLCLANGTQTQVCVCESGSRLESDGHTCSTVKCAEHLFLCPSEQRCISGSFRCDGGEDCNDGADEKDCLEECPDDSFTCPLSGVCLGKEKLCNGYNDCGDGSDEKMEQCKEVTCSTSQWRCGTGQCIPVSYVCDRSKDCADGSDEMECPCDDHQFKCNNGECIPSMWHCDGDPECTDGSDELDCTKSCSTDEFSCGDNYCISRADTCDGEFDCDNGSDETLPSCPDRNIQVPINCPENTVACDSSDSGQQLCVPQTSFCDGRRDCPMGDDELYCRICPESYFRCKNKRCIPSTHICDNDDDCGDGSDEEESLCHHKSPKTMTTDKIRANITGECGSKFECVDGTCIDMDKVCDGSVDCLDFSDEGATCATACLNRTGCQGGCKPTPGGPYCFCNTGFKIAVDGRTCEDINECENDTICGQKCMNYPGHYKCYCEYGYSLHDSRDCKRKEGEDWTVLYSVGMGLTNLSHAFHLINKSPTPIECTMDYLAFNPNTSDLYFIDGKMGWVGLMMRVKDGSMVVKLVGERSEPRGLSFDPNTQNLFFSEHFPGNVDNGSRKKRDSDNDNSYSTIMACSISRNCSLVHSLFGVEIPSTVIAVKEKKLIYCVNSRKQEKAEIVSSNLDGSVFQSIVRNKMSVCGSLALDEVKGRVYWTDIKLGTVETAKWNGEGHKLVEWRRVEGPVGLVFSASWLVWYNNQTKQLVRCRSDKENSCFVKPLNNPVRALLAAPPPLAEKSDICSPKTCSHLCTSSGDNPVCLCPMDYEMNYIETQCRKMSGCVGNICPNGSRCEAHGDRFYVCRCLEGRFGQNCEKRSTVQVTLVEIPDSPTTTTSSGSTAAIVIILLLIIGICFFGIYRYRNKPLTVHLPFTLWWRNKHSRQSDAFRFINPAFGVVNDQHVGACSTPPTPSAPPASRNNSTQFENPFFKDSEKNTSMDSAVASGTDTSSINISNPQDQQGSTSGCDVKKPDFVFSPYNPRPSERAYV